ncbi:MAG TPA: pseudouridine synthase [Pirellulaceae bacterium]|nr:pseudouridine synthase [Pirellulaceae bacterium]HMO92647.1 pseudouridine synthase [Pirellulaceae bacterium]HMP70205.1 pseudouridine synthase [Pirellulaceae bacterium]
MDPLRLQKFLAQAGFGSRRACESLILEGRVTVDDRVVESLGTKVDPELQTVVVDGQKVKPEKKRYFALNKPPGVLSTAKDPQGRIRVVDLIPSAQRIYNVGRLDQHSEGLLIVTNDGELANRLTHPKFGIHKTYVVKVAGVPDPEKIAQLRKGIYLAEALVRVQHIRIKRSLKHAAELEMVLTEGRNREIRRMLARIGHKVLQLKRIAIGSFRLGALPVGAFRELGPDDIQQLTAMPRSRPTVNKPRIKPHAEMPKSTVEKQPRSPGKTKSKRDRSTQLFKKSGVPKSKGNSKSRGQESGSGARGFHSAKEGRVPQGKKSSGHVKRATGSTNNSRTAKKNRFGSTGVTASAKSGKFQSRSTNQRAASARGRKSNSRRQSK